MKLSVVVYLLLVAYNVMGYKILVVFPFAVRSMGILGHGYVRHLLEAGHEVTHITAFPLKDKSNKNYREVDVSLNLVVTGDGMINITSVMQSQFEEFNNVKGIQEYALKLAVMTFENENVQQILRNTKEEFDAVIVDLWEAEILTALSALYDCPMIWASSTAVLWMELRLIDEASNPAYTAGYVFSNIPPLTFVERVQELWAQMKWSFIKRFVTRFKELEVYERVFGPLLALRGRTLPNYEQLLYNASLILSNEYSSAGNIPHTPQNFKFVGGQHIETPTKPLPQELQLLMDNAKHGVIYFSMGSFWKSKDIPKSVTEALLRMFGALKQTVIWKYEADLVDVPNNIHIVKWAPQHSILAHPNCLIFISHGGLLSLTEALHFGIPIIGVPVFFDQFTNIKKAVSKGYAIKVDLAFDLGDNLKVAISTMLADSKYNKKVKELSMIYHDRLVSPHVELVHWVEHVIRTRGAPHLRSPALMVPWYQKTYLDLAAVVLLSLICATIVTKIIKKKVKVDTVKKVQ